MNNRQSTSGRAGSAGRRAGRGALLALALGLACGPVSAQEGRPSGRGADRAPDLLHGVGVLPDSVSMVVAVEDLAVVRRTAAGRAFEKFLGEMSAWERSAAAWTELSRALDLTEDDAVDALLGRRVVLASGQSPGDDAGRAMYALMSEVSRPTEALLRTRLEPAPRGLVDGLPVLALEHGAFELATAVARRGNEARVLIAPRGSSALFDELLPVLGGGTAISTLSMTPSWDAARSIGGGDVYFLQRRGVDAETGEDNGFMALSATMEPHGFGARFVASDPAMLGDSAAPHGAWPSGAIDALERDALLCVAGSPESAGGDMQATLLLGLLDMLSLPAELRSSMRGVAVIAVHEPSDDPAPGVMAITLAMPFDDLRAVVESAEAWAVALTDGPVGEHGRGSSVRAAAIPAREGRVAGGYLGKGGAIAWGFTPVEARSGPAGWWVVGIRTGPGDPGPTASRVASLASLLERSEGHSAAMFRLAVRPSRLAALTAEIRREEAVFAADGAVRPVAVTTPAPGALGALRWIERVESRLDRGPRGIIGGTVSVRLRTELLEQGSGAIRE